MVGFLKVEGKLDLSAIQSKEYSTALFLVGELWVDEQCYIEHRNLRS